MESQKPFQVLYVSAQPLCVHACETIHSNRFSEVVFSKLVMHLFFMNCIDTFM